MSNVVKLFNKKEDYESEDRMTKRIIYELSEVICCVDILLNPNKQTESAIKLLKEAKDQLIKNLKDQP